jgi:hypothetical protein
MGVDVNWEEADRRGYKFDSTKLYPTPFDMLLTNPLTVTKGQLEFEFKHLEKKIGKPIVRNSELVNPLFAIIDGEIESWEKI